MQQDISKAFDEAIRKYLEETIEEDRIDFAKTAIMREAAKAKAALYMSKFLKASTMSNPRLGDKLLEDV